MASLTEVSYYSRKGINLAIIFGVAFIILRTAILVGIDIWKQRFPPRPQPATCDFGALPSPNGQTMIATPSGLTYSVETPTLSLPSISPTLRVYFMPPPPGPSFGSFEKMKTLAAKMGFTSNPRKLTGNVYEFIDSENPLRKLELDEFTNNFHLSYLFESDLSLFNEKNLASKKAITDSAKSYIAAVITLPPDLATSSANVALLKLDSSSLVEATSISNSDAAFVTFNRTEIDSLPILSPEINHGLISALVSGNSDPKKKILEVKYFYRPVDLQNWATYPSVNSQSALDALKAGNAIYASLPKTLPKNIVIRNVYLAYLDPYPSQSYLQPVIVFSDTKSFVAYVPAVLPDCTKR